MIMEGVYIYDHEGCLSHLGWTTYGPRGSQVNLFCPNVVVWFRALVQTNCSLRTTELSLRLFVLYIFIYIRMYQILDSFPIRRGLGLSWSNSLASKIELKPRYPAICRWALFSVQVHLLPLLFLACSFFSSCLSWLLFIWLVYRMHWKLCNTWHCCEPQCLQALKINATYFKRNKMLPTHFTRHILYLRNLFVCIYLHYTT